MRVSGSADRPVRVLLADHQPLLRRGYQLILQDEAGIDIVGEAGDGQTAIQHAVTLHHYAVRINPSATPSASAKAATRLATLGGSGASTSSPSTMI